MGELVRQAFENALEYFPKPGTKVWLKEGQVLEETSIDNLAARSLIM